MSDCQSVLILYNSIMSEFCENCPMRGQANGEISGIVGGHILATRFLGGSSVFKAGVLVDELMGASEPMFLPSDDEMTDRLYDRIERCEKPDVEQKGVLRRRAHYYCPAVGDREIKDSELNWRVKRLLLREIVR